MKTTLVFVHGWGAGDFIWDDVISAFADEYDCKAINLGFIGAEDLAMPQGNFIGVGHSLGGQWLLQHYAHQMQGFIPIASFPCFYGHVGENILKAMRLKTIKDASAQIKEFWDIAGGDHPSGLKDLSASQLLKGLQWLGQWNCPLPNDLAIYPLASRDDMIVPEKMTMDLWGKYAIKWSENGGHTLPVTRPKLCIDHIKESIDKYDGII